MSAGTFSDVNHDQALGGEGWRAPMGKASGLCQFLAYQSFGKQPHSLHLAETRARRGARHRRQSLASEVVKMHKEYRRAIDDVLDTLWFDSCASKRPDAYYVLSRLERRLRVKIGLPEFKVKS